MIDWLSCNLPWEGPPINSGHFVSLKPGGEIEWHVDRRKQVEGSWSDKVTVQAYNDRFYVSGNPAKYLQGHNLFGVDEPQRLLLMMVQKVLDVLEIESPITIDAINAGIYDITRIDLTYSFSLGSRTDAKNWIFAAKGYLSTNYQKIATDENTWYIGKHSRRLTIKGYYKGDEISKHPFCVGDTTLNRELKFWAQDKIRIEMTLRKMWMKEKFVRNGKVESVKEHIKNSVPGIVTLEKGRAWSPETVKIVFNDLLKKKVRLPVEAKRVRVSLDNIPHAVRGTYALWQQGNDVKEMLHKRTYYRHRKILREQVGIDIERPEGIGAEGRNVIPLIRALEAAPAEIPEWAREEGLVVGC